MYLSNTKKGIRRRIALFIPSLSTGGSERQLVELARGMSKAGQDVLIVTMYEGGGLWDEATSIQGVTVVALRKRNLVAFVCRLVKVMRRERVGLIYAFLSTAQLYSLVVKFIVPQIKLVYRIGDSRRPGEYYFGVKDALVTATLKAFSKIPVVYVLNSDAARASKALAVSSERLRVVHNGIDTDRFRPDAILRKEVRRTLGVEEGAFLVGCVGTFSVHKDHMTFVAAARLVRAAIRTVHFVTVGDDSTSYGRQAREHVSGAGMDPWFRFLGLRGDVERLLPACDVGCSSSITEGFPNAVCEFMSCGVPCVVTNVGDSSAIVGDTGRLVARSDPRALAEGILALLKLSPENRSLLGQQARRRIVERFSVSRMVSATGEILSALSTS